MQICLSLTSLILYLTVHLRLDSNGEPELAHFLVDGNVNSPSCHEYFADELHPWQGSSQTQLTAGLESDKLAWKLEWEGEEDRGFSIEGEVWEDELFSFTILSVLQTFFLRLTFWEATGRDIPKPFTTVIVYRQSVLSYEMQLLIWNGQPIPYSVVCNLYKMVLLHDEGREIWWCYTSICI